MQRTHFAESLMSPPPSTLSTSTLYPRRVGRYFPAKRKWKRMSYTISEDEEDLPNAIRIISWNVDFSAKEPPKRLSRALEYVQKKMLECEEDDEPMPCCILLQEVHESAFDVLLKNEWIRRHFTITPMSPDKWPHSSRYGNVTLVHERIPVTACSLEFGCSRMDRTALFTDLRLSNPENEVVTLRLGNTHLESLPVGAQFRPEQMTLVAKLLKKDGLHGGVVCGDMNSISWSDVSIPERVGLEDAWKGANDDPEGFTWGYQPPSEYPAGRLDKMLYTPEGKIALEEPEAECVGVKTSDDMWVSDHYGLTAMLEIL